MDPKKVASTAENGRGEIGWGPFPLLLATVVYPEISPIFPAQSFRGARGDGEVFYAFSEKTGRKREKEGRMTTSESWLFALMGFWSKREGKGERVRFWKKRVSPFSISPFFRGKKKRETEIRFGCAISIALSLSGSSGLSLCYDSRPSAFCRQMMSRRGGKGFIPLPPNPRRSLWCH